MKPWIGVALLALAPPALATGTAPLCVYSSGTPQCFYYSVDSCQSAARTLGGTCSPNTERGDKTRTGLAPAPAETVTLQHPNILRTMQEGQERGARERRAQEEHAARLRLIEAQTAAISASEPTYIVTYACKDGDGNTFTSRVPFVGCIVTDVQL